MAFERLPNERTLKQVLDALEEHCNPKKNETVERYMCNMRNQYQEETFDKYVTEIQLLGPTCNYEKWSQIQNWIYSGERQNTYSITWQ